MAAGLVDDGSAASARAPHPSQPAKTLVPEP